MYTLQNVYNTFWCLPSSSLVFHSFKCFIHLSYLLGDPGTSSCPLSLPPALLIWSNSYSTLYILMALYILLISKSYYVSFSYLSALFSWFLILPYDFYFYFGLFNYFKHIYFIVFFSLLPLAKVLGMLILPCFVFACSCSWWIISCMFYNVWLWDHL